MRSFLLLIGAKVQSPKPSIYNNLLSIRRTKCKIINKITDFCFKSILLNFSFKPIIESNFALKKALKLIYVNFIVFFLLASLEAKPKSIEEDPVFFINNGQWSNEVLAKAQLNIGDFWITRKGFIFNFLDTLASELLHERTIQNLKINTQAVFIDFVNCSPNTLVRGNGNQSQEYYNFYRGSQKKPVTGVKKFSRITVQNVWLGIDLEVTSYNGTIKYNWIVAPNADIQRLQWKYRGHSSIQLLPNQKCGIKTQWFEWIESIPNVYWANADGSQIQSRQR